MIYYQDFVPKMLAPAGFISPAEYEDFEGAVEAARKWIAEQAVHVVNIETVVLPNIWSKHEDGSSDTSLGTSSEAPSHWHQFVRVWYQLPEE